MTVLPLRPNRQIRVRLDRDVDCAWQGGRHGQAQSREAVCRRAPAWRQRPIFRHGFHGGQVTAPGRSGV